MESTFKVPIRNLYCMLSYMNEMPELIESLNDIDEDLITYDFIAKQFLKEVQAIHKRGIIKNYIAITETTGRLGGRLKINESIPHIVSRQPVVVCEKDHYSANIVFNQLMKSTLKTICINRYIKEETRRSSFSMLELMVEVEAIPLSIESFSRVYFAKHNLHYKRMIHIARLLHELRLLSHKHGNWSLFSAELDEKSLNSIFEKFLFQFYKIEQQEYRVSSEIMEWNLEGSKSFLPTMKTDVSLTHKRAQEKIIIDAKFYKNVFQENFGKSSFHSHNMYQLFTYLKHQPVGWRLRGILIYPFNGITVDEVFQWDESMSIEVKTVNLDDSWSEIYRNLLNII